MAPTSIIDNKQTSPTAAGGTGGDDAAPPTDDSAAAGDNNEPAPVATEDAATATSEDAAVEPVVKNKEPPPEADAGKNDGSTEASPPSAASNDGDDPHPSDVAGVAGGDEASPPSADASDDGAGVAASSTKKDGTVKQDEKGANDDPADPTAATTTTSDSEQPAVVHDPSSSSTPKEEEGAPKESPDENGTPEDEEPTCSCRRSTCVLLYCPCFGEGNSCTEHCKCKNCKNPKGANPRSKHSKSQVTKKGKGKIAKSRLKLIPPLKKKEDFPALLMLTVSPGRLGLTLTIVPDGGAKITHVDPACTFRGQVQVGDRIVTIDGRKVVKLEDLTIGKERVRKFGIVKKTVVAKTAPATAGSAAGSSQQGPTNLQYRDPGRKQYFPFLTEMKANSTDRSAEHRREDIMTELLQWDKKNNVNTTCKMGACRYQVLCVPLKRRDTVNKREFDNQTFYQYNKQTKFFDKFLNGWASYCDGTQEDAANMILFYMAKRFPQCYVQNFEMATKKHDKMTGVSSGPPPVELPPNFKSYDGTNDVKWNMRYGELVKYREEHGDCKVYTKTDLGRWVCNQRSARHNNAKNLTEKRIQLLDNLGFLWSGLPEGWSRPVPGGDPRQNRAIAAKLVYPDLTIREALALGGFEEEELNVVKDLKHTWRTGYVYYKDQVVKKVENYERARRSGARLQIEQLVNTLQSDDKNRLDQVFGDYSNLLPQFLEAAEERRRNGVEEKQRRPRGAQKRRLDGDDVAFSDEDVDQHEPARKMPHNMEGDVMAAEQHIEQQQQPTVVGGVGGFQPHVAYDHSVASAQQGPPDLHAHSWRQQGNYWR